MKRDIKKIIKSLVLVLLLIGTRIIECDAQQLNRIVISNKRTDSIDQKIKASIDAQFRSTIFDKKVKPDLVKQEKYAVKKYGETGEEVIWNLIALYYYLDFNNSKQIKSQTAWVEYKNKINAKYPDATNAFTLNNDAWFLFENSTDKKQLEAAFTWSKKAIEKEPEVGNWLDTYANLLYKLGRKKEAIEWEEKALQLEKENALKNNGKLNPVFAETLEKMKKGIPTWFLEKPKK